jgi:phospho-N-acetylmuramoyl-pentapeptide-transferase
MLYHLLKSSEEVMRRIGFYAYQDVAFRATFACILSFICCIILGPRVIGWLTSRKIRDKAEFNNARMNEQMKSKKNTPTMGGIMILLSIFISTLLCADLTNPFIQKALVIILWYGGIGGIDDWCKLNASAGSRDGLYPWEKLVAQFGGAMIIAGFLYFDFEKIPDGKMLWLPFYKHGIYLPVWGFVLIGFFYISATSNAVNLTDGMDGLASGCTAIVTGVLIFLCYVASELTTRGGDVTWAQSLLLPHIPRAGELSVFYASMLGAILGFMWFNCYPAEVFMGDTGSLPLGAAIGYGAIVTRNEVLLLIVGGVFMCELFSVMVQVGYFKYTRNKYGQGRRLLKCAPVHHHFHMLGWTEQKVVIRFWLVGLVFAMIAMLTLKLR